MSRWPLSLRARLTTWYTTILGVPLIAFAAASYVGLDRTLITRTDHFLADAVSAFSEELAHEVLEMPTGAIAIRVALAEMRFHEMQILVYDSTAQFVATGYAPRSARDSGGTKTPIAAVDVKELSDSLAPYAPASQARFTIGRGRNSYRIRVQPATVEGKRYRFVGAYPLESIREMLADVLVRYAIAIPFLLMSAAFGGYLMARRSLSPLAAMRARATQISATNLHERLPVANPHDELGKLAGVVNGLLARLEDAFSHQRRFLADASHELRTPVAILRTEADVTLAREHREEHEYRNSLTVMRNASRRLTRIVEDIFLLNRADSGHLTIRHEPVYLEEIVYTAANAVRASAEDRELRLDVTSVIEAPYEGDAELLSRLVLNLLDNAIEFSRRNGAVEIGLTERDGVYEITVTDDGPGIPAGKREQIFERFFRADTARSRTDASATSGAGLGLSIARWVAEAHGGQLDLTMSQPGRTAFRVVLPHGVVATHSDFFEANA